MNLNELVSPVTHKSHTRGHRLDIGNNLHKGLEGKDKAEKPEGGRWREKRGRTYRLSEG